MFDELSARFEDAVKGLRGQDTISETNVESALKDVRRALLEADVSLPVVKDFVAEVREKAVGAEVVRGVSPDQKFIQVVHEQLVEVMGGDNAPLAKAAEAPTVVLMAGLQGAGKTTATAKLGLHLKDQGRRALMVGADVYRPAAIDQLRTLGGQIGVEVFSLGAEAKPEDIAAAGLAKAKAEGFDTLLVDTAGRLQIDSEMMEEMVRIRTAVQPDEVLLVVDSMIGQEAAELTRAFHDQVGITGAVLTKLDGDSRGGAALSIRKVSGQPIKFIGTGEKVEALQPFHPERMASRILGMGDVETLIEKAEEAFEQEQAEEAAARLMDGTFTLEDFLEQMQQIKKMGPIGNLMGMMPGIPKEARDVEIDDGHIARLEGIIRSMTPAERRDPDIIDGSRRQRIAAGSGMQPSDVKNLLDQFGQMRKMMKQFAGFGTKKQNPKNRRGKNNKKGKKGGRRKQGGRVTEKGPAKVSKAPLTLPGLEDGELPPGFPSLPNS